MNRPRILLADDHSSVTERVSELLQPSFEVVGAVTNGKELLLESARLQPDVIVLDISMPELSGIEAAHELRSLGSTAKIVFLTVQTRVEFVRACLAEGALGMSPSLVWRWTLSLRSGMRCRAIVSFPSSFAVENPSLDHEIGVLLGMLSRLESVGVPFNCLSRNGGKILRGSSKLCQGACPRQRRPSVGLDRVCARATLPLSGADRILSPSPRRTLCWCDSLETSCCAAIVGS